MRNKKFLLGIALLLSPVALLSANSKKPYCKPVLLTNNKIVSKINEDETYVVENVTTKTKYENLQIALDDAGDKNELHLLNDITNPNAEAEYETSSFLPHIKFPGNKTLMLDGTKDETSNYTITGYATEYPGGSNVTIRNINFVGKKAYNDHVKGSASDCYFNLSNGAHLKFEGKVDISDYKHKSKGVFALMGGDTSNHTTIELNDGFAMHDCASRRGLIYCNGYTEATMNDGKIYNNCSTCIKGDEYFEGIVFYINGANLGTLTMNGGEICDNTARCYKFEDEIETNGTIYLKDGKPVFNMNGGIIRNNLVKRGGAVYVYEGTSPEINVNGKIYAYENRGYDATTEKEFNSNFYLRDNSQLINITGELDPETKIGVFTESKPGKGDAIPLVADASQRDLNYFFSDDEDYCIKYDKNEKKLNLYCYNDDDPRFTYPVFANGLHYNGKLQQLIKEPGVVRKGGEMLYSLDYAGDIEEATWSSDPTTIAKKEAGSYDVAYYVAPGEGCIQSELYQSNVTIGKELMVINWPEDNFEYNTEDQSDKLIPYYIKEGQAINLSIEPLKLEDGTPVDEFKDATQSPNSRYVLTAIDPGDESLDFPEEHSKFYTMRISEGQYIEEKRIEIHPDPDTGETPIVIEPEKGYDAWTTLEGCRLDKEKDKERYDDAVKDLNKASKVKDDVDVISGIYDVTMLAHLPGDVVEVVHQLDGNLKLYFKFPKGVDKDSNISIYRIHEDDDGNKKVEELPHKFDKAGYVSIVTDKLSAFAIVKHKTNLLWLIITLGGVNALLVGGIVFTIVKKKKKAPKKVIKAKGGKK